MDDEFEIRRARLQRHKKENRLSNKQLAAAVDRSPDYISRLLHGGKNLSGDMARVYEQKLGLHKNWLDGDDAIPIGAIEARFRALPPMLQAWMIERFEVAEYAYAQTPFAFDAPISSARAAEFHAHLDRITEELTAKVAEDSRKHRVKAKR